MDLFVCPLFGEPTDFGNFRTTQEDIIRLSHFYRVSIMKESGKRQEPSFKEIAARIATKVMTMYQRLAIPSVNKKRVIQKICQLRDRYVTMKRSITSGKRLDMKNKASDFKKNCLSLFEVVSCKSSDFSGGCCCVVEKKSLL